MWQGYINHPLLRSKPLATRDDHVQTGIRGIFFLCSFLVLCSLHSYPTAWPPGLSCSAPRTIIAFLRVLVGILHSLVCVALLPAGCPFLFPSADLFPEVPFHLFPALILSWYLFWHHIHSYAHNYLNHVAGNRFCKEGVQSRIQRSAGEHTMVQVNQYCDDVFQPQIGSSPK